MISFVCWKWFTPGKHRLFESQHVNVLRAMVARHYREPHRFICITDEPKGLDERIEVVGMPVTFDELKSPHGVRFPSCYRRLWVFSRQAREVLGDRIFSIDIDVVIVASLRPLVKRKENFVGWCDERHGWNKIAGGCYMLTTGSMAHVWERFDPTCSPQEALKAGNTGSDQGWMSHVMYPPPGRWDSSSGISKITWCPIRQLAPPADSRIIFTNGTKPPWSAEEQRRYPWIKDHWRL